MRDLASEPVISVRDLTVSFASEAGTVHAVRGMNFDLYPGKTLGIVAFIVSFFFGLLGLILGIVALVQSKKAGRGNGFAIAAIIIGGISVIVGLIVIFAVIVPSLKDEAEIAQRFPRGYRAVKPYLRLTPQPNR